MTILDRLADHARRRTEQAKRKTPLAALERQALSMPKGDFAFEAALKKPGLSFICECKRASPSKGLIGAGVSLSADCRRIRGGRRGRRLRADGAEMVSRLRRALKGNRRRGVGPLSAQGLYGRRVYDLWSKVAGRVRRAADLRHSDRCGAEGVSRHMRRAGAVGIGGGARGAGGADGAGRWRPRHRCEQPQPQGLYGGRGEQPPAARADSARRSSLSRRAASGTPEIYGASAPSAPTPYWSGKR